MAFAIKIRRLLLSAIYNSNLVTASSLTELLLLDSCLGANLYFKFMGPLTIDGSLYAPPELLRCIALPTWLNVTFQTSVERDLRFSSGMNLF